MEWRGGAGAGWWTSATASWQAGAAAAGEVQPAWDSVWRRVTVLWKDAERPAGPDAGGASATEAGWAKVRSGRARDARRWPEPAERPKRRGRPSGKGERRTGVLLRTWARERVERAGA